MVTWTKDTDPSCSRMWPKCQYSPGGKAGHSDLYDPRRSMVLRYQHGVRCQPRPQVVTWLSIAIRAIDINIDPGCDRVRNPDVGPDHKSRVDFIMALDSSTGHVYLCGPSSSVTLRHQYGWLQVSVQALGTAFMKTEFTDIDADTGCSRDPHMTLRSSSARITHDFEW